MTVLISDCFESCTQFVRKKRFVSPTTKQNNLIMNINFKETKIKHRQNTKAPYTKKIPNSFKVLWYSSIKTGGGYTYYVKKKD